MSVIERRKLAEGGISANEVRYGIADIRFVVTSYLSTSAEICPLVPFRAAPSNDFQREFVKRRSPSGQSEMEHKLDLTRKLTT